MCLHIQVNLDFIDFSPTSKWRTLFSSTGSRVCSFSNKSGESDSVNCPLREAPVTTKPLLELKPIEGGDAQGIPVLSEKPGVGLLENPIP